MKQLSLLFTLVLLTQACQQESSGTARELQKLKSELEARKNELSDKQKIAEIEQELEAVEKQIKALDRSGQPIATDEPPKQPENAASPKALEATPAGTVNAGGTINGTNVTMRKEASTQSEAIGSFEKNERVEILNTKNVNNENEAILARPTQLYVSASGTGEVAMTLPKGKAVFIEGYNADNNKYEVSYQVPKKGKYYAQISADAVETITYSTWYRVKRTNGETGWVLGKFVNQ